jgi:hypothetical protein
MPRMNFVCTTKPKRPDAHSVYPTPLPMVHYNLNRYAKSEICKPFSLCVSVWRSVDLHVSTERENEEKRHLSWGEDRVRLQESDHADRTTDQGGDCISVASSRCRHAILQLWVSTALAS